MLIKVNILFILFLFYIIFVHIKTVKTIFKEKILWMRSSKFGINYNDICYVGLKTEEETIIRDNISIFFLTCMEERKALIQF